jgi:hypothetical protein
MVEHLYDLIPVDLDRSRRLFETAVQGSALQVDEVLSETLGLRDEEWSERFRRRIKAQVEQRELAAADAGPAAAFGVAGAAGRADKGLVPAEKDADLALMIGSPSRSSPRIDSARNSADGSSWTWTRPASGRRTIIIRSPSRSSSPASSK